MITLRRSADRGHADHGWLQSRHSFSFADYHDPRHMGVGNLRVLNEDRIAPGTGFGAHAHRDMEIVSVVVDGALAHRDSLGHGAADGADGVVRAGDVQRMSAGTGVRHSEFNPTDRTTHFLQIWIEPRQRGLAPGYEQTHVDADARRGRLALVASPDGRDGSLTIHADASIAIGRFDGDESAAFAVDPQRLAYVHVVAGSVSVNGTALAAGDAVTIDGEPQVVVDRGVGAEVVVFDLAR